MDKQIVGEETKNQATFWLLNVGCEQRRDGHSGRDGCNKGIIF